MTSASTTFSYPDPPRSDVADQYHGVAVADPYRPLEDLDAPATRTWIEAENRLTDSFLAHIPARETIRRRLTGVWNYERFGIPHRVGPRYVFGRNSGLQNQSVIFVAETLGGPERVLLDPNALSPDGTVALTGLSFSDDGALAAYATSASGSDWMTWRVRDVASGADLEDELRWSKFSGASWRRDGSGFYYCAFAEPDSAETLKAENYDQQVRFHRLGTPQADDVLVYARPDHRDWIFGTHVTDDGRWLVISAWQGSHPNNRVFVMDLSAPDATVVPLLDDADAAYDYVGNDGTRFYFRTTKGAPRGRIVAREREDPGLHEVVAEGADALEGASLFEDTLVLVYIRDAHTAVRRARLDGASLGDVALPGLGSASGFDGKRRERETFFSFTSYTTPSAVYRLDPFSGDVRLIFAPKVAFDPNDFVSEQLFYTSKDGTRIPMIVSRKRSTPSGPSTPTILYGYGGFNISLTPAFSPSILVWLELGGVFAVANLRGGGEYGEQWHLAGTKERKQNVFDDFIAGAEYLISSGRTSSAKLAISGGSNGGLLVGAAITQRPELVAAALPQVGVFDMLRFQKFTIGWGWTADYGSSDDAEMFPVLRAYSPLHNIRDGVCYPATLITTGDHDDRVFPAHSFKFAAALQAVQRCDAPVLIRIETKAGHGAGKPTGKMIDEATDRYAFLVKALDMTTTEVSG